jgi:hypothetical protein
LKAHVPYLSSNRTDSVFLIGGVYPPFASMIPISDKLAIPVGGVTG